jgi:hypothetical protein
MLSRRTVLGLVPSCPVVLVTRSRTLKVCVWAAVRVEVAHHRMFPISGGLLTGELAVRLEDATVFRVGEWMGTGALVAVMSCGAWSVLRQVTVSPTRTVRLAGLNA